MKYESTMIRGNTLIKNIGIVLVPALLSGLLAFQLLKCGTLLERRNAYLLENLPVSTDVTWDALSGYSFPNFYSEDDQPGGISGGRLTDVKIPDYESRKNLWLKDMNENQKEFTESVLISGMPSFTVHYLWCVDGHFEMIHYISVLSALHQLRPDKLIVHYRVKPRADPKGYWRWLEDLERDVIMLSLRPLKNPQHCRYDLSAGVNEEEFPDAHGVFLLGDVAITNLTRPDIVKMMALSFLYKKTDALELEDLMEKKWSQSQVFIVSNVEPFHVSQSPGRSVVTCPPVTEFNNARHLANTHCVSMNAYFYMEELLNRDTRFFRYTRTLLYGSPDNLLVQKSTEAQIPKIFHIILGEDSPQATPLLYISIKSAYMNGKVDIVYVHCHKKPRGELWDRLLYSDHLSPEFIPTASFKNANKNAIKTYLLYTLLQHGGMASLGKTIFVKPWSFIAKYPGAVASLHRSQYRQEHRTLNTAVLAAAPGSKFIQEMLGMIHQSWMSWPDMDADHIATHLSEVDARSLVVESQLTSHQDCQDKNCMAAGGHNPPQMAYTTRLLWKGDEPNTLKDLSAVQGPFMAEIRKLI